jgi:hypothetical protein
LGKGGSEFVQQPAQGVGLLGAQLHQQFALAMQGERSLLRRSFNADKLVAELLHSKPIRCKQACGVVSAMPKL